MALNPGDTRNNDHYRIVRQLGRGGFGFVYLAQDTLLGEQVAIKELIPALVGDEAMLKRFLAEARATMRLTHERIVRTHNVFREDGNYYIVMECMAGDSLEARLRAHGPLPVGEAVRVAAEVCEGLAYAHQRGIVHCDLKPANILFDKEGQAKVADFGIAHISGEMLTRTWMTPAGFVAGTLPYMSPEQADGVRDNPRIDVYALGAVLFRMLTGRTYLDFDNQETPRAQMENLQRIYGQRPEAPSTHQAGIPTWLDAVILKALAKRPEERYTGAAEMRAALLRAGPHAVAPAPQPAEAEPPTVLVGEQASAAEVEPVPPPAARPAPSPAARDEPRPARSESPARAAGPVFLPLPEDEEAAAPDPRRASRPAGRGGLPAWFWPAVGAAAVLVVLVIAIGALVRGGGTGLVVGQIRWNDQPLEGISVDLIAEADHKQVAETVSDASGNFRFENVATGEYRIGVNGYSNSNQRNPLFMSLSSGHPFSVNAGETYQDDWDLSKNDLVVLSPEENAAVGQTPTFTWEPYPGAAYYRVYLFRRVPSFEQTLMSHKATGTSLTAPETLGPGTEYDGWVYAVNENGTSIAKGDIPHFSVAGDE